MRRDCRTGEKRPITRNLVFLFPWMGRREIISATVRQGALGANLPHSKAFGGNDHGATTHQSGDGGLVR
jgi:hypothetical protein